MPLTDVPPPNTRTVTRCKLARWADTLDPESAAIFQGWLDNPDWPNAAIAVELDRQGMHPDFGVDAVRKHRKRICACRNAT
jgi:hypothetical protein